MLAVVTSQWSLLLVRGLTATALGTLALVWPSLTLDALVAAVGAYALLNGMAAVAMGVRSKGTAGSGGLLFEGLTSTTAGILVLLFPTVGPAVIAAWAIVIGTAMIAAGTTLRDQLKGEWPIPLAGALLLIGALSLALGFVVAHPLGAGGPTVVWMVIAYAMLTGIAQIALAIRIRQRAEELTGN